MLVRSQRLLALQMMPAELVTSAGVGPTYSPLFRQARVDGTSITVRSGLTRSTKPDDVWLRLSLRGGTVDERWCRGTDEMAKKVCHTRQHGDARERSMICGPSG